jgi:hypothetical protein
MHTCMSFDCDPEISNLMHTCMSFDCNPEISNFMHTCMSFDCDPEISNCMHACMSFDCDHEFFFCEFIQHSHLLWLGYIYYNTVWFNFQTYIIFSINLVSQVTLRSSGTYILYGCHMLRCLYNILYFLWLHK